MPVSLEIFVQALIDALEQITVQISTIASFFERTDDTTVSLPSNTTFRTGRVVVSDGNGGGVDLLDRFDSLNNTWNAARYNRLVEDIESLESRLSVFSYNSNKNVVTVDADVTIAGYLTVDGNMFVGQVLNQTNS